MISISASAAKAVREPVRMAADAQAEIPRKRRRFIGKVYTAWEGGLEIVFWEVEGNVWLESRVNFRIIRHLARKRIFVSVGRALIGERQSANGSVAIGDPVVKFAG